MDVASLIMNSMNYLEFSDKSKCIGTEQLTTEQYMSVLCTEIAQSHTHTDTIESRKKKNMSKSQQHEQERKSNMNTQNNCQIHSFIHDGFAGRSFRAFGQCMTIQFEFYRLFFIYRNPSAVQLLHSVMLTFLSISFLQMNKITSILCMVCKIGQTFYMDK